MNTTSHVRSLIVGGGLAALASAMIAGTASADTPPNCTGADYAGITSGVAAQMSAYLFTHPEFNAYVTELEKIPPDQSALKLAEYQADHPDVRSDVASIRQPLRDFDRRCGFGPHNTTRLP